MVIFLYRLPKIRPLKLLLPLTAIYYLLRSADLFSALTCFALYMRCGLGVTALEWLLIACWVGRGYRF
jgi:hypothetical protein